MLLDKHTGLYVVALSAGAFLGGCSSGGSTTAGSGGATSTSGAMSSSKATTSGSGGGCSGMIGNGGTCPGPTFGGGEVSSPTQSVTAKIVDETGAPVADQPVFICGIDICSAPGKTGADGSVTLTTDIAMMKRPAFKFGDSLHYSEFGIALTASTTDFTTVGTGKLATGKLTGLPSMPLTPGTTATSGDVAIEIPAGATIAVNTLVYDTCDDQAFRAVGVPLTNEAAVLDPVMVGAMSADFKALYAASPAGTTICPAAKVTVALPHATTMPNDFGWAPGTAVEFWVMTVDAAQEFAPYAGWAKMSDGVVSVDGKSASTGASGGFIYLDNFAIRKAS